MAFDFTSVLNQWPLLLSGMLTTLLMTVLATGLGLTLGIACGWSRAQGPRWLKPVVGVYIEVFRNTPYIVQLFFIFFGLPAMGWKMSALTASVMSLVLNLGAYAAEITRAGIESTPRSQLEAAQSLALNRWQIFTRVVLPPALARVWPALVSQVIIIMFVSAVCSQIYTEELSYSANLIASRSFRNFEAYIVATVLYLGLAVAVRQGLNWFGPRFIFGRK
ncbi:amino acid ABC transporter permease [Candidatus Sodalis endolongispinus]|uniref:Amino acid ABC transporter permease n=2 Tax=Candidatus Sodalis endolongispinus TaxID=2812662 RepID=A0ABS5YA36_9GAMM|nr:amino acid ABC transporter permease [Candidatus Sodalis endolongispinus]MBT9431844.1 amino acid ABC transporter permease [Candidatus Sodalis endolongispinus]